MTFNGNVIWKNQSSSSVQIRYIYNSFGQMTQVDRYTGGVYSATLARYYYDANGARAKTDESGTIYRYIFSSHDPMYYNSTDGKGHKDVYLGGRQELRIVSPTEKWAYMADALGSTRKVLQNGRTASYAVPHSIISWPINRLEKRSEMVYELVACAID